MSATETVAICVACAIKDKRVRATWTVDVRGRTVPLCDACKNRTGPPGFGPGIINVIPNKRVDRVVHGLASLFKRQSNTDRVWTRL